VLLGVVNVTTTAPGTPQKMHWSGTHERGARRGAVVEAVEGRVGPGSPILLLPPLLPEAAAPVTRPPFSAFRVVPQDRLVP